METRGKHSPSPRKSVSASKSGKFDISRRQFLIGAAVAGTIVAAGGGVYVANNSTESAGTQKLSVPTSNVFGIDACEQVELSEMIEQLREVKLPYNSIIKASSDGILAALSTTDAGNPLNKCIVIDATTGDEIAALESQISSEPRWDIIDFSATKSGCAWIEANMLTDKKRVFTSNSIDAKSSPQLALELDSNWMIPTVVASGNTAWIQLSPSEDNNAKAKLLKITLGASEESIESVLETKDFACFATPASEGVCVAPRDSSITTSYKLTYINNNCEVVDCCTLPTSMVPQDISYGNGQFSFTFSGSYDYGDGLSTLGTYTSIDSTQSFDDIEKSQVTTIANDKHKGVESELSDTEKENASNKAKDTRNEQLSSASWFFFNRSPLCQPVWLGNLFAVKSTKTVAVFNPTEKKYCLIEAADGADDYGVWLCSSGESDKLVTLTNIDYTTLKGESTKECRVQIWEKI